jgi:ammonia channel protein AmtB
MILIGVTLLMIGWKIFTQPPPFEFTGLKRTGTSIAVINMAAGGIALTTGILQWWSN